MLIVFDHSKGGTGKTTLAVHTAVMLHDRGHKVALLDVDDQHLSSDWVQRCEPSIDVFRAKTPTEVYDHLAQLNETDHDFIIGDGPAGHHKASVTLLVCADLALYPLMLSALDIRSTVLHAAELLKAVEEARTIRKEVPRLDAFSIINGVDNRTKVAKKLSELVPLLKKSGLPPLKSVIRRSAAFANAPFDNTVVTRMPVSQARQSISDLEALLKEVLSHQPRSKQKGRGARQRSNNERKVANA